MKFFVGCSASNYIPSKYFEDCKIFLEGLFEVEHDLVFGGCKEGLMGVAYNIARKNGRKIEGIYPRVYKDGALKLECFKMETDTVAERTEMIIRNSDALIFLPGGIGTIYELFTVIECRRAYEFAKPIIIYNSCGYFDKLFEFLDLNYDDDFASRMVMDYYYVCDNVSDCLDYIDRYYCIQRKVKKKL